jgi:uncharacterized membrane-anchored protein
MEYRVNKTRPARSRSYNRNERRMPMRDYLIRALVVLAIFCLLGSLIAAITGDLVTAGVLLLGAIMGGVSFFAVMYLLYSLSKNPTSEKPRDFVQRTK